MALRNHHERRGPFGGRKKKLYAGVRLSLYLTEKENRGRFDCQTCDERQRDARNCDNRHRIRLEMAVGLTEILTMPLDVRPVLKIEDCKFFACPLSCITGKTWQILQLVNEITDENGIRLLPFPGALTEQPGWLREAVKMVMSARTEHMQAKAEGS